MENETGFLGQGWAFPPGFSKKTKTALMVAQENDIEQSLQILLSTGLGERLMQAQYGCDLRNFVFELYDQTTLTFLRDRIETAIIYHEPRIIMEDMLFSEKPDQEGKISIVIYYKIRQTNTRTNLVFPFYFKEATDLFNRQ